jgi:acyl carrier protein
MELEQLKSQLKSLIIESLNLQDVKAQDIKDSEPLFVEGLGLDSIDALELSVAIEKKYKIKLDDEKKVRAAFASINTLAAFIEMESGHDL